MYIHRLHAYFVLRFTCWVSLATQTMMKNVSKPKYLFYTAGARLPEEGRESEHKSVAEFSRTQPLVSLVGGGAQETWYIIAAHVLL